MNTPKSKPVLLMTRDGGLPNGNWPRNELVPYVRADLADALAEALRAAPGMINRGFAAGVEEREGGSVRRQGKILDKTREYEREIASLLAAYEEARNARP